MASTRIHPLRLLVYLLVAAAGFLLFVRPDLLGRLTGADEAVDPCVSPLAWYIRSVDPRFGFTQEEIRRAVGEAARAWEDEARRPLFRSDTAGMAIDLVYDARQRASEERQARDEDLAGLEAEVGRLEPLLARLLERAEAAERRLDRQRSPATLQAYRDAVARYNVAVNQYNRAADRYNEAVDEARAEGGEDVTAGNLRSERRTLGGRVMRVDRELTVAVAGGYEELVVVLAHELGHALGLTHVADPDALMAATYRQHDVSLPVMLAEADRRALAERCRPGP